MSIFDLLGLGGGNRGPTTSATPSTPAPEPAPLRRGMFSDVVQSDGFADVMQAAGLSLLSSPRQNPLGGMGDLLPAIQKNSQARREKQEEQREKNETLEFLRQHDPEVYGYVQSGMDVGDAFNYHLKKQEAARGPKPTAEMQNWRYAETNEAFRRFLNSGRGGRAPSGYRFSEDGSSLEAIPGGPADVDRRGGMQEKPPTGFRWTEDGTALEPIPGGPGEQIGGENAGRIGIAQSFLDDLEGEGGIREAVEAGGATGIMDAMAGKAGLGQAGRLHSRIDAGVDALQRMLSGAGTPEAETARYARRYMATPTDTVETLTQKLDQLKRELNNQMAIVMRGRGGVPGAAAAPSRPAAGTSSSGVKWSIE